MLLQLSVRNIVLIDRLALEFAPGFNVITGETGAGKSMLVDALNLVLGGRARPELLRSGTDEAEVEALFEIAPGSRAAAKLEASGIPGDRELVVRRVLQAAGGGAAPRAPAPAHSSGGGAGRVEIRTRAYINGRLCTAAPV